MRKLDSNAHSVFLLYYHLILVIKYRKKILTDPVSERAREIFEYIAPKYHVTLEEWNHDRDHVHIMFRAHPKSELSKFINAYKSASSRLIKKEYPEIRQKLWKEMFWSQSFCLLSAGGAELVGDSALILVGAHNDRLARAAGVDHDDLLGADVGAGTTAGTLVLVHLGNTVHDVDGVELTDLGAVAQTDAGKGAGLRRIAANIL